MTLDLQKLTDASNRLLENNESDKPEYQYLHLLNRILTEGEDKPIFDSNTGEVMPGKSLRSLFGAQLRFDLSEGFPLYTTKKVFWRGAFEEMLWFIKDRGNVTALIQKDIHIWDDWAWKYYQQLRTKFQVLWSLLHQASAKITSQAELVDFLKRTNHPLHLPLHYTNFTGYNYTHAESDQWIQVDQMQWVVENLPKRPERKSYYVTCWNPAEAYQMAEECGNESVVIVACHIDHLVNISNGRLNLRVGIR